MHFSDFVELVGGFGVSDSQLWYAIGSKVEKCVLFRQICALDMAILAKISGTFFAVARRGLHEVYVIVHYIILTSDVI